MAITNLSCIYYKLKNKFAYLCKKLLTLKQKSDIIKEQRYANGKVKEICLMASIEKRGNSYRIKVSCGYKADGTQVTQRMTWTPDEGMTEKQIEKELQRVAVLFEEDCKRGQIASAVKFEAFSEEWFEDYAKLNLKSTTYARQRQLTKRVYAAIGHIRLDKLTTREIQKFINSLAKDGVNENTGKALSRKTMVHYLSFISTVIDYAIKMDMLIDNPCRRVTIPKGSKKERKILTIVQTEEFFKLLQTAPLKYRAFFTLDIYTGMRRGEMLGLEWKDIDFETGVIHIQRTSNYTKARGIYTDTTKTESSVRYVKVPAEIIEILKQYKDVQDEERDKLGSKWHDTDRLFVKFDGQPMNPQTPYGWLKDFCEKNGLPFYGIHQFRHPYVKYTTKNICDNLMKIFACTEPIKRTSVTGIQSQFCYRGKRKPV